MALIREEEITFGRGLNILTGETGAGKSILIGSINVALGSENLKNMFRREQSRLWLSLCLKARKAPGKN